MTDEAAATGPLDRHQLDEPAEPAPARTALDQIEAALDDVAASLAQMG